MEIWQCDAAGSYSQYGTQTAQTYLRGIQTTDSSGQVTFTTIYPGWYAGRATHIHVDVTRGERVAESDANRVSRSNELSRLYDGRLRVAGFEPDVEQQRQHFPGQPRL